jgi:DNA-binding transcriptional LysR family regulator
MISRDGRAMPDLNSLIIFAHVVEAKGFSKAARRLKMPTSTVSRRIAELEQELGVRLIERSTRALRLTEVGAELLEHAQRSAEISEAIGNIASNHLSSVSGNLRLAAPPSISDSLLAPIVVAFQSSYLEVSIQVLITERIVDQIAEGVDLAFRVGVMEDSSLVARKILTYRHQLVASPEYLQKHKAPKAPQELLEHRLLAFSFWRPENTWNFVHANGKDKESITFRAPLSRNQRVRWARGRTAGGHRNRRPSTHCSSRAITFRPARRGDAEMAFPRISSLAVPSCKSLSPEACPRVQGFRGKNGARSVSVASDLDLREPRRRRFVCSISGMLYCRLPY